MANGVELGVGYVSVIPAWGAGAAAKLGSSGTGIGKQAGGGILQGISGALGPAALTGIGAIAAGGIAAGFAAFKLGDSFDAQFDKIRVGTGAVGSDLDGLKTSFKDVLSTTATGFDGAGDALTGVAQKLDLVGKPLEDRTKQFLDLSRITGTDLTENLNSGTDAIKAWQVSAEKQGDTLDLLFRASQQSGASFSDLAGNLAGNSTVFKALGFNMEQATTVLAGLAKGGLDANEVMPALSRSIAAGAKEGKPARKVYQDLIKSIKDAPDEATAAAKAFDVLGARAGPKFAQLVRSGKFSFDDLGESIAEGTDTISSASKDTADFSEKFEILKNRVLVGLEPLASKVFDAIGNGMDALMPVFDDIASGVKTITTVFSEDGLAGLGRLVETAAPILGQKLLDLGTKLYEWIQPQIEPLLGKAGELIGSLVTWLGETGLPLLADGAQKLSAALSDWLLGKDGKTGALKALLDKAPEFLRGFVNWIDNDMTPALEAGGKRAGAALAKGIVEGTESNLEKILDLGAVEVAKLFPGLAGGSDEDPLRIKGGGQLPARRAAGGPVPAGFPVTVGEKGQELWWPDAAGTIIPHAATMDLLAQGGSGGTHLHVIQRPGEDPVSTGMRALKWHQTVQMAVASR